MNPSYPLFIDVCLAKPLGSEPVWLRYVTRVPFVPRAGDKLRIPLEQEGEDEGEPLDITFVNVTYDIAAGAFFEEQEDDEMVDNHTAEGVLHEAAVIAKYSPYGFRRLNYPQGVAR